MTEKTIIASFIVIMMFGTILSAPPIFLRYDADVDVDGVSDYLDGCPFDSARTGSCLDRNIDGVINKDDIDLWEVCATSPGIIQFHTDCRWSDLDGNGSVDQVDLGIFQPCLGSLDPKCYLILPSVRYFSVDQYVPEEALTVTIQVFPDSGTLAWATEDTVPAGWVVTSVNLDGWWDTITQKVKWGSFFDNQARVLSYNITPPSGESGNHFFHGVSSFNGTNIITLGSTEIKENNSELW